MVCSIGSLGKDQKASVWGVIVNRVYFDHTTNGFRIKTWQVILHLFPFHAF
jgi:hypothetical protein